jgi:hypothetical protein
MKDGTPAPPLIAALLLFACARGEELRFEHEAATVLERASGSALQTTVTFKGVATWHRSIRRNKDGQWLGTTVSEYQWPGGKLLREETYTPDPQGQMIAASASSSDRPGKSTWSFPHRAVPATDCTPEQLDLLRTELSLALRRGAACMRRYGRSDIAALIMARHQHGLTVACARGAQNPGGSFLAAMDPGLVTGGAPKLSVDLDAFFHQPDGVRARTLWHELLHLWTGPHLPGFQLDHQAARVDRTNACVSLCFDRVPGETCTCELCLGVPPGDYRCREMRACEPDDPATHPPTK